MKTQFRASFAKDLRGIKNKAVLRQIKETIEQVEKAKTSHDITNLKKLKAGAGYYRIRVGEHRIGLSIEDEP